VRIVSAFVWITVASLAGGILVAMAFGGADSPWIKFALVAIILATAVVTGAQTIRKRRRIDHRFVYTPAPADPAALEDDLLMADQVDKLLSESAIPWITTEEFVTPWRDDMVAPFRQLVRLVDSNAALVDVQLDIALENLASATRAFLQNYETETETDTLLREDTWRLVRHTTENAGFPTADGEAGAARLREGAARLVRAYSELQTLSRAFWPAA
jgi:hypothetical protein